MHSLQHGRKVFAGGCSSHNKRSVAVYLGAGLTFIGEWEEAVTGTLTVPLITYE